MDNLISQFFFTGLTLGSIYSLTALGFHVIYNATGIINFAQGQFAVIGGLVFWSLWVQMDLPLPIALALTLLVAGGIGAIFERVLIYPTAGGALLLPVIMTLAGDLILRAIFYVGWGPDALAVPPFSGPGTMTVLGAAVQTQVLWTFGLAAITMAALYGLFTYTFWGRALVANSINPEGAQVIGLKAKTVTLWVFVMAAVLGGMAGALAAPMSAARYDLGLAFALKGFAGAVLGGLNSAHGVVLGSFAVALLETFTGGLISTALREPLVYTMIIVVLVIRPWGIFGRAEQ